MKRIYYIIVGLIVIGLIVFSISLWLNRSGPASGPANSVSNVPDYSVTDQQLEHFRQLVQNFVEGYNTYSYYDYTALLDEQGNSTPAQAAKIQKIIDQLQSDPGLKNYAVIAIADPATLTYRYPAVDTFLAEMDASVTATKGTATDTYKVRAKLALKQLDGIWLLDDISLSKIN